MLSDTQMAVLKEMVFFSLVINAYVKKKNYLSDKKSFAIRFKYYCTQVVQSAKYSTINLVTFLDTLQGNTTMLHILYLDLALHQNVFS